MRTDILIALAVGAYFFFMSAIVTALAIKYATSARLWDVVLMVGIAGMICSIATLALFVNSQNKGLPFLWPALLTNLGICLVVAGVGWHFSSILRKEMTESRSPLRIIFDVSNPHMRFWERTSPKDKNGNRLPGLMWQYRVKIENTSSSKTVRNVRISRESSGLIPELPSDLVFQKNGKQSCDLHPKGYEYVAVLRKFPPQVGDAWGETAKKFHGPIKIVASGDDVAPAECEFDYYPDQIPAIVQRGSSQ